MKKKKKKKIVKALLNGKDVVNVEQLIKNVNACVATKMKPWNTVNYWV